MAMTVSQIFLVLGDLGGLRSTCQILFEDCPSRAFVSCFSHDWDYSHEFWKEDYGA